MAYPFFSLAKTPRTAPIDFRMNEIAIRVEAVPEHGMATIWDADVLIWAASQIVEARDAGAAHLAPDGGHAARDTDLHRPRHQRPRLPPPEGRAGPAAIHDGGDVPAPDQRAARCTASPGSTNGPQRADAHGHADGIDLIMPDWFYRAVLDDALVLTIDRAYFDLTGGLERWLYRIVRKHGGQQRGGWRFDFRHLHAKSASLSPFKRFAFELRDMARRQPLPGYRLAVERETGGRELLAFARDEVIHRRLWTSCGTARAIRNQWRTCHREPARRAIRNQNRRFHQLNQQLLASLT